MGHLDTDDVFFCHIEFDGNDDVASRDFYFFTL